MFLGVFQTKDKKLIVMIMAVILLILWASIFIVTKSESNRSMEQAVMAENYLKAGNYDEAIKAYHKAISMKNSNQELLSIGLSEAYVGLNEYDKALEILRSYYQKTSEIKIKEKIEEVISRKTDYEYLQLISRADIYLSNKEYDKAIAEYEKAKLIKSKEAISYQRITEALLEKGEYDLALMEVLEGKALTQSEVLQETLELVETHLQKKQYEEQIIQADEYIYQENYEDGIKAYKRAIYLMPNETKAYVGLASAYLTLEQYASAVTLLGSVTGVLLHDKELGDLYDKALELQKIEDEQQEYLRQVYEAMKEVNPKNLLELMNKSIFDDLVASEAPIYYKNTVKEETKGEQIKGIRMVIYDDGSIYLGDMDQHVKIGQGTYFKRTENKQGYGYYYYKGEWSNNIPNGVGKTEEEAILLNEANQTYISKVKTEGIFCYALEDEVMRKTFYVNGAETGNITYIALKGVPQPYTLATEKPIPPSEAEAYVIAPVYKGKETTGSFYTVDPQTVWGVKPFLKIKK